MRIAIAADHAGLPLRQTVADTVRAEGHEPLLLGPDDGNPVDYPVVARVVAGALASGRAERGILVCGSGAGVTVAANKLPGIRAAYGADHYTAHQMVEHDDCNVMTLGGRVMGPTVAGDIVTAYVNARFSGEERHARRLAEVLQIEQERNMNPATSLHEAGQSLWLDNITRQLLDGGQLARYVADGSITGLTSNPTIFDKAISGSGDYDQQIGELAAGGLDDEAIFFELALGDLRRAAGLFRPTWDSTGGRDGWVSLEVSPRLAHDTASTVAEARSLHEKAAAPNLFIKVPGTVEGLPAIEELIAAGIPVNVTLLFSDEQYLAAAGAYQRGLRRRQDAGQSLDVASVASLFVSRWDHATVEHLPDQLKDALGVAVAKRTYRGYRATLASAEWKDLQAAGARPQRLLFASTGTKDPALPDTFYVQELAAPDTINTMPQGTLDAFIDHGTVGDLLAPDGGDSDEVVARVEASGVDVPELAAKLQADGASAFVDSWEDLLATIARTRARLGTEVKR
jgi:transaldolase